MTTTSQTSFLAKPHADEKISERTLGYVTELAREEVFDLVATACVEAGVTRAQIAKRLGKDSGQVSRQLAAPGNWTIDTVAEYMFAINGSILAVGSCDPLDKAPANNRFPMCLEPAASAGANSLRKFIAHQPAAITRRPQNSVLHFTAFGEVVK